MRRINEMLETVERVIMIMAALMVLKWLALAMPITQEISRYGLGN